MADYVSNGFFIVDKHLNFDETIRSGKCQGTVPYPKLTNEDEELFMRINDEIHDFAELYSICNSGEQNHFSVNYDVPNSGTKDFFSVLWLTKKDDQLWRTDVLNFNAETGSLLNTDDVFHIHSNNLFSELAKLSEGRLSSSCSWEQFLEKIEKRDIQFYIKNNEWFLVFNSTPAFNNIVEIKIPQYFLIQRDDHDNE
ncbi:MAG: hypothetical protein H0U78_01720 [Rickettsiaceae bacterium]|jgi:hypothetical protein|nr:hypothetical protein [Rickettsiaceae bacterium]